MSEPGSSGRGRVHDAEGAREAILNAAEIVFAEHGFDGARVDAIAAQAGYNKSLIFQYFGDKLNLYAEVVKRMDQEMGALQANLFTSAFEDESTAMDPRKFRAFLEIIIGEVFDYLVAHPRLIRMLNWEQAEGWQTYKKIFSQFNVEDNQQFDALFRKAHKAGIMRSDFFPIVQLTIILEVCQSYIGYLPLLQMILPGEDFSSPTALARAREYIVGFTVAGIMADPKDG